MNKTTKNITITALFAIIIAVCSWIALPIGSVPITLQTFSVALCGFLLGKRRGVICTIIYLLMGAIGLPVFSSMQGGFGVIISSNGGFLIGFIALAFFCGFAKDRKSAVLFSGIGILLLHTIGIIYMCLLSQIPFLPTLLTVSLPYLAKDIICLVAAFFTARRIKKEITL